MMRLDAAAQALDATFLGNDDAAFTSISTDTRTIEPGALFVALRGERFDGHDYVQVAQQRGAAAAMVARDVRIESGPMPLIIVDDPRLALGRLARHWRSRFTIPLIAVVGSNGKTTVKEMTGGILRAAFGADAVLATAGNFNNDIGLPLTLLRLRDAHRCAVIEIGMNHVGETKYLAGLAQPTIALVNNAQREHQEFMKNVLDVALEHAAAIHALPRDGTAVFNADDDHAALWRQAAAERRVRDFGLAPEAAVRAEYRATGNGTELLIQTPEGNVAASLCIPGVHNVRNALAAVAAATAAGASLDDAARGLNAFRAVEGRLQQKAGRQGARLIDDTYNANPDSVRAAIDVLAQAQAPRILVLGDMGEVGVQGPSYHEEVGLYAKQAGIDYLFAVGDLARVAAWAFGSGGEYFPDLEQATVRAEALLALKPTVLIKGSRFMRMDRVVERLAQKEPA